MDCIGNNQTFDNVYLIIRSAGERTVDLCRKLILDQGVPENRLAVVREVPFSAAMRRSFELGIESGLKWTFCIDADVLLRPGSIAHMVNEAEKQGDNVFEVQGLIVDKFIPVKRPAGNHCYRTSLLEKSIPLIPEEGSSLRPENAVLNEMARQGYPYVQCDIAVGIHDFEQYYEDIYRKCFLQAHKHKHFIPLLEPYWIEKSREDPDFLVAVMALRSGKVYGEQVFVDRNFVIDEARDVLAMKGIAEKDNSLGNVPVSEIISESERSEFLISNQEKIFPKERWNCTHDLSKPVPPAPRKSRFKKGMHFLTHRTGSLIEKAGRLLKNSMED